MLKDKDNYRYDIVETEIKPRLAVDVSSLPMHAAILRMTLELLSLFRILITFTSYLILG